MDNTWTGAVQIPDLGLKKGQPGRSGGGATPCNPAPEVEARGLLGEVQTNDERESPAMKRSTSTPARTSRSVPHAVVTTLGDLISAAYDAVPGAGAQRLERALALLTRSPLARQLHPQLQFTR